jgi:hypothetical protein
MQQQHVPRQYVRKWLWLLRQHTGLAMCLRLLERTLNTRSWACFCFFGGGL